MVGPIRSLRELARKGGAVSCECQGCAKVSIFAVGDLAAYWRAKGWSDGWPGFAQHLKCSACGAAGPMVRWIPDIPPCDPQPPRPRLSRAGRLDPPEPTNVIDLAQRRRRA